MKKKRLIVGFGCFVSDIISGVLLGLYGRLHLALGLNCSMIVFHSSFYWKLG